MLLRVAVLGMALTVSSVAWAAPEACAEASFETGADFRAWPAWLRDPCWHRVNALLDTPASPVKPLALPDIFADSSEPGATLPSPAESRPLPSQGFGWATLRDAPAATGNVGYGDNAAVYRWVARMSGGAKKPQREALDDMTRDLHMPVVTGGPAAQMLALGMLVGGVVLRRRQNAPTF
jgi:hypothetical protein